MQHLAPDPSKNAASREGAARCRRETRARGLVLVLVLVASLSSACEGASKNPAAQLEFRGEAPFVPGLAFDSKWLPDVSPVAVRATATASGRVAVVAIATIDGGVLLPVANSGVLSVEGGLSLELSARIDTSGISFEDIVDSFEYTIPTAQQSFEPFALDAAVEVTSMLPAAELAAVPIPSVPGATLVLEVTGGEVRTSYQGSCAEVMGEYAAYSGVIEVDGTVECAATVEIEVPLVGSQSFGPFAFEIPLPASETPVDLGTRSLSTGEPAAGVGICEVDETATGETAIETATDEMATDETPTNDTEPVDDTTESTAGETTDAAGTSDGEATGASSDDPAYPRPHDGQCPAGYIFHGLRGTEGDAVCLPACAPDGSCPSGSTGTAWGLCDLNPGSSYAYCTGPEECPDGEICIDELCVMPSSHCVLSCDETYDDTVVCPDAMVCEYKVCMYPG